MGFFCSQNSTFSSSNTFWTGLIAGYGIVSFLYTHVNKWVENEPFLFSFRTLTIILYSTIASDNVCYGKVKERSVKTLIIHSSSLPSKCQNCFTLCVLSILFAPTTSNPSFHKLNNKIKTSCGLKVLFLFIDKWKTTPFMNKEIWQRGRSEQRTPPLLSTSPHNTLHTNPRTSATLLLYSYSA